MARLLVTRVSSKISCVMLRPENLESVLVTGDGISSLGFGVRWTKSELRRAEEPRRLLTRHRNSIYILGRNSMRGPAGLFLSFPKTFRGSLGWKGANIYFSKAQRFKVPITLLLSLLVCLSLGRAI